MGIVDVNDICYGDPLFTLSLTYAGSEIDGHDTDYADAWAGFLGLDIHAQRRLEFYRLLTCTETLPESLRLRQRTKQNQKKLN